MRLVVDANVLVSAFLKEATSRELLFDDRLELFAPDHLVEETRRVLGSKSLLRRLHLTKPQFEELFSLLIRRIRVVSGKDYAPFLKRARELAPHEEDGPYLALALALKLDVWSNDKGMKGQDKVAVYSTRELLGELKPVGKVR